VNRPLAAQADKVARIDDIATQVASAFGRERQGGAGHYDPRRTQTQAAVNQLGTELATIHEKIKHMEEAHVAKAAARAPRGGEPAVAGPGEYIVKPGDTGVEDRARQRLHAFRPGVGQPGRHLDHLKVGEKLKLPEKK
jgi:hypothetical protein